MELSPVAPGAVSGVAAVELGWNPSDGSSRCGTGAVTGVVAMAMDVVAR